MTDEKPEPKFKKDQVVMLTSRKKSQPFKILDVTWEEGGWFYAWNRKNYVNETMIRSLTPKEIG